MICIYSICQLSMCQSKICYSVSACGFGPDFMQNCLSLMADDTTRPQAVGE